MSIEKLISTFGLLDAVLIIIIVVIFREWRKAENAIVTLLKERIEEGTQRAVQYEAFRTVLQNLAEALKG